MWEYIPGESGSCWSYRLKVPGGWIVRSVTSTAHGGGVHQIFVTDVDHKWVLEEPRD